MRKNLIRILLVLSVFFLTNNHAVAQTNYSNVRVDEWSDLQIRQLMQRAESIGYNDQQLEQMAAAQGMRQEEIVKLRARVKKIRESGDALPKPPTTGTMNGTADDAGRVYNNQDSIKRVQSNQQNELRDAFGNLMPKVFGAELFANNNITFEPNLNIPTPQSYVLGAGDQLLIDVSGTSEANYKPTVSPDGFIRIEYISPIQVSGLTIAEATSRIRNVMAKVYRGINNGTTRVAVNLGNIRSIRIVITGEVVKPGNFTLPSFATVFTALYASGGPAANGSFRKIQLIRNNIVVSTIDAYDFLVNGIQKGNIRLQDGDVIKVPVFANRVEVSGEVKRPAIFETLPGENFRKLLEYAGGFSQEAFSANVKVLQITDRERRIGDIPAAQFDSYMPKNGDKFIVERILDRFENRVDIMGAVFRPGQYQLEQGLTLKALIQKANGLKEDAFMERGYISRLNANNTQSLISFDLAKIMSGTNPDIILMREDRITINSLFDLRDEYKVTVQGEVRMPGEFDYADNMSLESVIQLAGGFKEGATPSRVEIARRIKDSDATSAAAATAEVFIVNVDRQLRLIGEPFILQPFDIISIRNSESYEVQKQVYVQGEVLFPGPYTIKNKNERISDLIKRAGGFTPSAYIDGASLKRPGPPDTTANKNAINKYEDEEQRLISFRRFQEDKVNDKRSGDLKSKSDSLNVVLTSDLVGIDLRRITEQPGSRYDLILEDGDIIQVPKQLQTVKVSGEVLNPNNIVYNPSKGFKYYINGAGGFGFNGSKKDAFVKYANGSVASASKVLFFRSYPRVLPGAEILVPRKPEREKITAQAWIGIGTGIASLAAIILTIIR